MNDLTKTGTISLYNCGGAGVNIGSFFEQYRDRAEPGFSLIESVYIDTSHSNISKNIPEEFTYIFDGLDGSGKVRKENAEAISQSVLDILHKFKPGDLCIVISSSSGGSGSVIAPAIVSELIARNIPTIVCAVGSNDSRIEVENTIKTLKSYESIAKMRKAPVAIIYRDNSQAPSRKDVDVELQSKISTISTLFSRQNKEMDTADLHNWLYYTKVTSFEPKLVKLEIFEDKIEDIKNGMIISVATLALDGTNPSAGTVVEYQCVGYVPTTDNRSSTIKGKIHYVLLDGIISEIYKSLTNTISKLDESKNSRIAKGSILTKEDVSTGNGLVF